MKKISTKPTITEAISALRNNLKQHKKLCEVAGENWEGTPFQMSSTTLDVLFSEIDSNEAVIADLRRQLEAKEFLQGDNSKWISRLRRELREVNLNLSGYKIRCSGLEKLLKECDLLYGMGVASVAGGTSENQRRNQDEARELMRRIQEVLEANPS